MPSACPALNVVVHRIIESVVAELPESSTKEVEFIL